MTISAQSIIQKAQETLQDVAGVRWPAPELVSHLNDGLREIAELRPDFFAALAPIVLITGPRQALPASCIYFFEIQRNTNGAAIRQVQRNMLDSFDAGWYTKAPSAVIRNFLYDVRERDAFYVYPPAIAGTSVDAVMATMPAEIPAPGGAAYSTVTGNIPGKDNLKNPLLHFVLFRAYTKNAEFAGNAEMSAAHYQLFKSLLGDNAAASQATSPTTQN